MRVERSLPIVLRSSIERYNFAILYVRWPGLHSMRVVEMYHSL